MEYMKIYFCTIACLLYIIVQAQKPVLQWSFDEKIADSIPGIYRQSLINNKTLNRVFFSVLIMLAERKLN
jgi:hypothetical protein